MDCTNLKPSKQSTRLQRSLRLTVATAATMALSMSEVTAFQSVGTCFPQKSQLTVVTDPEMMLSKTTPTNKRELSELETQSETRREVNELEALYMLNEDINNVDKSFPVSDIENFQVSKIEKVKKPVLPPKTTRIKFKGLTNTTGRDKRSHPQSNNSSGKSRTSTMPGFAAETDRQRAYRDGIRLVERKTGKKIIESPEGLRSRRKANGESMYKNSASVPDSLIQFAGEIHREDRITRKEEIDLGEKTQAAMQLQGVYDKLASKLDREPTDAEWCAAAGKINVEAIRQTIEEGLEAKNLLVTSNLRMVQSVVNTYIRNGLSGQYNAGDMMQEGVMALIRAAEKFDPQRGFKFSTYAMYWVRASVKRSQIFQSRIVNVPQRLYENHKRLIRVEKEMHSALGRRPTKKELGQAVGMSELQVERCLTAMSQRCFSLDQEINNSHKPMSSGNNGDTLIELLGARTDDGEYDKMKRMFAREDLIETLNRYLTPSEVEILLLRYGLKEDPLHIKLGRQLSIADLSRIVGLKPDKVRRIISKSLRQLKAIDADEWLSFERELR